jgi:hypothetical protein
MPKVNIPAPPKMALPKMGGGAPAAAGGGLPQKGEPGYGQGRGLPVAKGEAPRQLSRVPPLLDRVALRPQAPPLSVGGVRRTRRDARPLDPPGRRGKRVVLVQA